MRITAFLIDLIVLVDCFTGLFLIYGIVLYGFIFDKSLEMPLGSGKVGDKLRKK